MSYSFWVVAKKQDYCTNQMHEKISISERLGLVNESFVAFGKVA
jgi:hypothetical protein